MANTRRDVFSFGVAAALTQAIGIPVASAATAGSARAGAEPEGQRRADLGNGSYRNPVLAGDNPDPSVLKDGATYYKVSSSFDYYPGLLIWTSQDLVNWRPVAPALPKLAGAVYAPDLVKHDGRFFIYFAAVNYGQYGASSSGRVAFATAPRSGATCGTRGSRARYGSSPSG